LPQETVARVVALTQKPAPGETTHWTSAAMAKASGISQSAVLRDCQGFCVAGLLNM
jgi:hypothetical protein